MAVTLEKINFKDNTAWYNLLNLVYPVGSYYWSNKSTSPATLFGGTWAEFTGAFCDQVKQVILLVAVAIMPLL